MAAGFSVKDALNKNSKAGIDESPRARFRTKDISIFKMYRNDMNFYSVADIEELAGDILLSGLKQNLELVYAPCEKGEYRIVAGERRWEALKYLVSKGYKDFELATSKLTTPQDDDEEQVEIIIANSYRSKTISDMIEEETRLKASLERMKAAGKKIKGYDLQSGRLRDVISSMLHVSKTKIAQIEAINNNLIPEWKEELKKERLTFSAAYELSGMTEDEQRETLGKFSETGELTHKEVKDMKEAKAAGQQVSESDTEENGMNPPEARAGDDYETPHPEGITSLCYSCTEYETCNVKTGTCTSCDQYKNRAEAYKTDEQRYSEEQDAIDRETKKKLREMEQEEKMQKLQSTAPEEIKTIRVSQDKFEEYTGEYRKPYMITKDDGFKVGNVVKLVVFVAGKATGETADMRITCKDDDITCSGLSDGWCVIGLGVA
jgi:ParB family chromosome partitioning protein